MRASVSIWAAAVCAACMAACGGAPPAEPPELVLGTGEWQFEPVEPGQSLTLAAGTQGGYHIWLSMRARGIDPERVRMQLDMYPEGAAPEVHSDVRLSRFEPLAEPDPAFEGGGWVEYLGWPAQLLMPWCAVGEQVRVEVTLEDWDGVVVRDETVVTVAEPLAGLPQGCDS